MLSWTRVKLLSPGSFPECSQCSVPGLSEVLSELSTLEGIVRTQQHSCAQTRQLQGESPEDLRCPGKHTQHSRKQGQSCQNPPGSRGLEGYRSLSCWLLDRSSRPVRDPDSISGRRKGQGGTAALRWVCPPARRPAELAAAPGLCPSTRPGRCTGASPRPYLRVELSHRHGPPRCCCRGPCVPSQSAPGHLVKFSQVPRLPFQRAAARAPGVGSGGGVRGTAAGLVLTVRSALLLARPR